MIQCPFPVHPCVYTSMSRVSLGLSGDSGSQTTLLGLSGDVGISTEDVKETIRDATYSLSQPVKRVQEDSLFRESLFK